MKTLNPIIKFGRSYIDVSKIISVDELIYQEKHLGTRIHFQLMQEPIDFEFPIIFDGYADKDSNDNEMGYVNVNRNRNSFSDGNLYFLTKEGRIEYKSYALAKEIKDTIFYQRVQGYIDELLEYKRQYEESLLGNNIEIDNEIKEIGL